MTTDRVDGDGADDGRDDYADDVYAAESRPAAWALCDAAQCCDRLAP